MTDQGHPGPLAGLKVVEFASIGPGPLAAMLLADLGAEVLRIDRKGGNGWPNPIVDRGRAGITIDIRTAEGRNRALAIAEKADVLIEGMRPGVMERLGLGPQEMLTRNPGLVYGRVTGWGQEGPLACTAGHDINYIAITGALAAIGRPGEPAVPPLNLVGDFGGGSLYLVFGIMAALWERRRSGRGQVVDAAIVDGVVSQLAMFGGLISRGMISLNRDRSLLGGAAHFYGCYICRDGKEISVGALEPQFYRELLDRIGAPLELRNEQNDAESWQRRRQMMAAIFATKTRDEWCEILAGSDACFAPVLTLEESVDHPHLKARGSYVARNGILHTAPAPRFSRTPGQIPEPHSAEELLRAWDVQPVS